MRYFDPYKTAILAVLGIFLTSVGNAAEVSESLASKSYVDRITGALSDVTLHVTDMENPHATTAAQIGLSNVKNVDQTNADNLTSGVVPFPQLPVGTTATTVAAGNDSRFDTIPTSMPTGTPAAGRAFIWLQ